MIRFDFGLDWNGLLCDLDLDIEMSKKMTMMRKTAGNVAIV